MRVLECIYICVLSACPHKPWGMRVYGRKGVCLSVCVCLYLCIWLCLAPACVCLSVCVCVWYACVRVVQYEPQVDLRDKKLLVQMEKWVNPAVLEAGVCIHAPAYQLIFYGHIILSTGRSRQAKPSPSCSITGGVARSASGHLTRVPAISPLGC